MKPQERFTIGQQPCAAFLRGDADIAALGDGNRRNLHQCPVCEGNRAWCDACHSDHHDGGWETCKPSAYSDRPRLVDDDNGNIVVSFEDENLRSWVYLSDGERRQKMLLAREYIGGWCDHADR